VAPKDRLCPAGGDLLSPTDTPRNGGIYGTPASAGINATGGEDAPGGPYSGGPGTGMLPADQVRGLPQPGTFWWREEKGEYCLRTAHQPAAHATIIILS